MLSDLIVQEWRLFLPLVKVRLMSVIHLLLLPEFGLVSVLELIFVSQHLIVENFQDLGFEWVLYRSQMR